MGAKRNGVVVRDYQRATPEGVRLRVPRGLKWQKENPAKRREVQRRYEKTPKGRAVRRAVGAKRRAREKTAAVPLTPAEQQRIVAIYAEAIRRTAETGIAHHVDHDVPLALGGKHHPDNLLVVPAALNLAKGAKYASTWDFINS